MYKTILFSAIVASCLMVVLAGTVPESQEVQDGMKNAFLNGLKRFNGEEQEAREQAQAPQNQQKKIFSHYTKDLTALGGGKPLLREQNRIHHYTPLGTSVLPREIHIAGDKMTAAEAAKIYVPQPTLQYHEDRTY